MKLVDKFKILDKNIITYKSDMSIGLANGLMGQCIYFYYMSKIYFNKEFQLIGDDLINEILLKINEIKTYDLKNGLIGVGLGIDYLIENKYLLGDSNEILKDIDDELYKQICYADRFKAYDLSVQLELVYYFLVRIKNQDLNKENSYLFNEVVIYGINSISDNLMMNIFEEKYSFDFDYLPAFFLYTFSCSINLCNDKIYRILDEFSPLFLSKIPISQGNRLYYLYAIDKINKKMNIKGWKEHADLLARELDIGYIIENELSEKMFLWNGLSGIYIILSDLSDYFDSFKYMTIIIDKIEDSLQWDILSNDGKSLIDKYGFFLGYTGPALMVRKYYDYESKFM